MKFFLQSSQKWSLLIPFLVTKVDVFVTVEKSYVLLRQHFYLLVLKVLLILDLIIK
jgi:hypothetical protein